MTEGTSLVSVTDNVNSRALVNRRDDSTLRLKDRGPFGGKTRETTYFSNLRQEIDGFHSVVRSLRVENF